jgi:hypothetical protein
MKKRITEKSKAVCVRVIYRSLFRFLLDKSTFGLQTNAKVLRMSWNFKSQRLLEVRWTIAEEQSFLLIEFRLTT